MRSSPVAPVHVYSPRQFKVFFIPKPTSWLILSFLYTRVTFLAFPQLAKLIAGLSEVKKLSFGIMQRDVCQKLCPNYFLTLSIPTFYDRLQKVSGIFGG